MTTAERFAAINLTVEALLVVILAMFVIEGMRVLGRASEAKVKRTPFKWREYFSDPLNVLSLVVSFASSVLLLIIRDGFIDAIGLAIKDETHFAYFYAAGVGAFGQVIVKMAFKAFGGMFGAFDGPVARE